MYGAACIISHERFFFINLKKKKKKKIRQGQIGRLSNKRRHVSSKRTITLINVSYIPISRTEYIMHAFLHKMADHIAYHIYGILKFNANKKPAETEFCTTISLSQVRRQNGCEIQVLQNKIRKFDVEYAKRTGSGQPLEISGKRKSFSLLCSLLLLLTLFCKISIVRLINRFLTAYIMV